jgi:hypothetical protein
VKIVIRECRTLPSGLVQLLSSVKHLDIPILAGLNHECGQTVGEKRHSCAGSPINKCTWAAIHFLNLRYLGTVAVLLVGQIRTTYMIGYLKKSTLVCFRGLLSLLLCRIYITVFIATVWAGAHVHKRSRVSSRASTRSISAHRNVV